MNVEYKTGFCRFSRMLFAACPAALLALSMALPAAWAADFQYPANDARMEGYFWLKFSSSLVSTFFAAGAVYLFLENGTLRRALNGLSALSRRFSALIEAPLAFVLFYLLLRLLRFPFTFFSSYLLEHQYGLSEQSLFDWAKDEALMALVSGLTFVAVAVICHLILKKIRRFAFLFIWALVGLAIITVAYIEPVLVEPMFNKFQPLPASKLKTRIERLSARAGVQNPLVLVADKSRQTLKLNAYVNGLGASHRIVLFDNLLESLPEDEIAAVVAHELGHYRLKHVITGVALAIVALLPLFYFAERCLSSSQPFLLRRWGIKSRSDPLLIAPVYICLALAPLVLSPISSLFSRLFEAEADAYAIRLTGDPLSSARSFVSLSEKNNSLPDPPAIVEFWFYSHPSLKHRIDYALAQLKNGEKN